MSGTPSNSMNLNSTIPGLVTWDGTSLMSSTIASITVNNYLVGTLGASITSATQNAGYGLNTLNNLTTASSNTAFGQNAANTLATGGFNTAIGQQAMFNATSSVANNTAIGWHSMIATIASDNVAVGYGTMSAGSPSGINNVAVGVESMLDLTSGTDNTCIGFESGLEVTTNSFCTFIGSISGGKVQGSRNTALGYASLFGEDGFSGTQNIAIGYGAGGNYVTTESNNIVIGSIGVASESNIMRLGTQGSGAGQVNACYIAGIQSTAESSLTTPKLVYVDTTDGQLGCSSSLVTAPSASSSSSLILGTAYQNTTGSDIMLIVYINIGAGVGPFTAACGIGPTSTPTQQTIISGTVIVNSIFTVPVYIPNNYYALISTTGFSASILGQQAIPI